MENRRWKLKRKFPVPAEFLEPAYLLREYEGKEIFLGKSTHGNDLCISIHCGYYFPISWLTEIKEPLTFEEWFHSKEVESLAYHFNDRDAAEKICKAWVKNQKLGHVVDEEKDHKARLDYLSSCSSLPCNREIWNKALKYARGLND